MQIDKIKNFYYFWIGIFFMLTNKIRHSILGYRTPRPFSIKEYNKCIDYDFTVVDNWLSEMDNLTNSSFSIEGKNILELGPGADLGVGLILLAKGVQRYNALDIFALAKRTPKEFYSFLFQKIAQIFPQVDIDDIKQQLQLLYEGRNGRLNYIVDSNFSFSKLATEKIDIVFSQATLDALDNIEKTFKEVTRIVKSGGYMLSTFDLQTHTRWIRNKDPLNIYRYSNRLYKLLSFKGSPNRLRPNDYIVILEKLGWEDIKFIPDKKMKENELRTVKPYLYGRFKKCEDINYLNGLLFAKKCA